MSFLLLKCIVQLKNSRQNVQLEQLRRQIKNHELVQNVGRSMSYFQGWRHASDILPVSHKLLQKTIDRRELPAKLVCSRNNGLIYAMINPQNICYHSSQKQAKVADNIVITMSY